MSGRNLNRFNRYRTRDRAREKVLTREEIMRECFSDENEAPMVFPMGHSATAYAREVLATSKGVLEVTTQGESWIPANSAEDDRFLEGIEDVVPELYKGGRGRVSREELRREISPVYSSEAGHEAQQISVEYRLVGIGGFKIRKNPVREPIKKPLRGSALKEAVLFTLGERFDVQMAI